MEDLEDKVIDLLSDYWGDRVKDFAVKVSTSQPYQMVEIEFTAYNFMVIKLTLERDSVWFSQLNNGVLLRLKKDSVPQESLPKSLVEIDDAIRLRIPDKYLEANGW